MNLGCTVLLLQFGMEMWARYAHKSLWHDLPSGWALHKSHHEPRTGPFEANDIFAIINGKYLPIQLHLLLCSLTCRLYSWQEP
jgi:hypothetical protein